MSKQRSLGFGVSAWTKGAQSGHLDGIGVYTQALYAALMRHWSADEVNIIPYAFGDARPLLPCGMPQLFDKRMSQHRLEATFLKRRLSCPVDWFHATDHHIPSLCDVPVVATVMDLIPFLHPEWVSGRLRAIKNELFKRSILSADHYITISEHSKRDMMTHFGIAEHRISVTPLGVDACYFYKASEEDYQRVLQQYQLSSGFFLFIGTLQPRKNLETLLDAHARLPAALQKRHPLVIVGRVGWKVDALVARLRQLEHEHRVRWLNYVPQADVMVLLQCAQALTFVSLYEGFGLPILEAFAAACPVLASNTTSIPEVALDAAHLVDPCDPMAITDGLMRMIDDGAWVNDLKQKGASRAALFTWDTCAKATIDAYACVSSC